MSTEDSAPCEFLPWDTDFFGFRVARVTGHRLNADQALDILRWCQEHQIECLYFLADAADQETTRVAENHGFRLVDIRVTLQCDLGSRVEVPHESSNKAIKVRPSRVDDIPALQEIARNSHRDSRFYADSRFPVRLCDALYETWIQKSCTGYADTVLVAEFNEQVLGYVSCHLLRDTPRGRIGLVGVTTPSRGQGVGSRLVNNALDWFRNCGVETVEVVTQGRNIAAQRLYQRCGFLTHEVQLWYHRWMPPYLPDADR